ncbi:hypothetical protein SteCoe_9407 [Stentor coeruleus]|uniref:Uncharacterized protein n=1 Tax=Stentor coeruleus TaxID=5963 RepID=A0A1R2CI42_9CILI|nr:hypothetical protein SteCoe_9407 [Stentor coeruleus]
MGNCFSSSHSGDQNKVFEDFYYLLRDKKYLLRISDVTISKFKIDNSIKVRKDSGVGYLNDGRIIVGGGTDGAGCLTNKAYIITPHDGKVSQIEDLPVASKEGAFFQYKNSVYYIGAIKDSDDEEILAQEQCAPIMKYELDTGGWVVFEEDKNQRHTIQDYLKKKLKDNLDGDNVIEIGYKEILYAGMFMIKSKVYFINGQRMKAEGTMQTLTDVFSIDLDEDNLAFKAEEFALPLKVFRPICGSYENKAFITGGLKPDSKGCNMDSYLLTFNENGKQVDIEQIPGLKLSLDDSYPMICSSRNFVSLAYPNLALYSTRDKDWLMFTFGENLVRRETVKHPTPYLDLEELEEAKNPIYKHQEAKTIKKPVTKLTESISSGESIRIDLPPGLMIEGNYGFGPSPYPNLNDSRSSGEFSVERRIEFPGGNQPEEIKSFNSSSAFSEQFNKKVLPKVLKPPEPEIKVQKKKKPSVEKNKDANESSDSLNFLKGSAAQSFSSSSIVSNVSNLPQQINLEVPKVQQKVNNKHKKGKKSSSSSSSESFEFENKHSEHESDSKSLKNQQDPEEKKKIKSRQTGIVKYEPSMESFSESFEVDASAQSEKYGHESP